MHAIAIYAIPVLLAVTLHEAAHGYVAMRLGDITAYAAGRVSLNPFRHIDPVGTVAFPLALLAIAKWLGGGGLLFGWAKPLPVNFSNLRDPRRDMLWVAAAGPLSNLVMAFAWGFVLKLAVGLSPSNAVDVLMLVAAAGVLVNVIFTVLNLLPLPPLDGGRMLASVLPRRVAKVFGRLEPFGLAILLVLLFTGVLGTVLWPLVHSGASVVATASGVSIVDLLRLAQLR